MFSSLHPHGMRLAFCQHAVDIAAATLADDLERFSFCQALGDSLPPAGADSCHKQLKTCHGTMFQHLD